LDNAAAACERCNKLKGNMTYEEFRAVFQARLGRRPGRPRAFR